MTEPVEEVVTEAARTVGQLMSRPPFDQLVAGTEGQVVLDQSPTLVVLNLSDLSTIAAVHNLRILVDTRGRLSPDKPELARIEPTGWVLTWKPGTPEKPWGVFA